MLLLEKKYSLLLFWLVSVPINLFADTDWSQCGTPVITPDRSIDYELFATQIEADTVISENKDYMQFSGQVELKRESQHIFADQLNFFRQPERLQASGNLVYLDDFFRLEAKQLSYNMETSQGLFSEVEFQLFENHLSGSAHEIRQLNADLVELYQVRYSTCDPGRNDWSLTTAKLSLDQASGFGTAHDAVLRIAQVPVFYFPWFRFPITDDRLSGVLTPTLAYQEEDGITLSLPVYWNLAPHYDMTITPIWYDRRGLQLNTENRYLFQHHRGALHLSWLDDDQYLDERWYRRWQHEAGIDQTVKTSILIQRVSDSDFLNDFDGLENIEDVDYLPSSIQINAAFRGWDTKILFDEYQTINLDKSIASRPYQRLPLIALDRQFVSSSGRVMADWDNEWVEFDKEQSVTGNRLHIVPTFKYILESDAYYFKPTLQLDLTQYELDNNTAGDNDISRAIPLFSIDSGLIFERQAGASANWVQTLEPRLYLLHVPYEDQSQIPDFDTSLLSESYNNLFINNRFSGADRIGDAKQLSFGLTTRLLEAESGNEFFSASIGQAFYADDRRVSLDNTVDERDRSNLITSLVYQPDPLWDFQITSVYDQEAKESAQTDVSLRRHDAPSAFNLEYRFRRDSLEQSTVSFVYPVSNNWTTFAKRQHSIREDKPVQNLLGFAYESCCWGLKLLFEESSDNNFEETDRSVYFQLTLKGLSSAGKDINSLLEDGILGYQPKF